MGKDALREVSWICTNQGRMTPQEVLLRSHDSSLELDLSRPGFEVGAQFRFLLSVLAVAIRHQLPDHRYSAEEIDALLADGLSTHALDTACEDLSSASDVFGDIQPFMQRPALKPKSSKDTARRIGAKDQEVKKLSPAMPSDQGEDYWNLLVSFPKTLDLEEAVLKLVTYHYYSMAGNNKYDGDKTRMGAPGIRYPGKTNGKGNTATEFFWCYTDLRGESLSLLRSLLASLPKSWVKGDGLPSWADRTGVKSRDQGGNLHPLWIATWSSNTAASFWEGDLLTGVRVGGVPPQWLPFPLTDKEAEARLKRWWDVRNEQDPLYLYMEDNGSHTMKAQRVDFGRDATDLAVDWIAEGKINALEERGNDSVLPGRRASEKRFPVFLRHKVEGTATSPSIRASQVLVANADLWGFQLDEWQRMSVRLEANLIRSIQRLVVGPFRGKNSRDERYESEGRTAFVIDGMEASRQDAVNEFWRNVTAIYEEFIQGFGTDYPNVEAMHKGLQKAAVQTFDNVTRPYLGQFTRQIFAVRGLLVRFIDKAIHGQ